MLLSSFFPYSKIELPSFDTKFWPLSEFMKSRNFFEISAFLKLSMLSMVFNSLLYKTCFELFRALVKFINSDTSSIFELERKISGSFSKIFVNIAEEKFSAPHKSSFTLQSLTVSYSFRINFSNISLLSRVSTIKS
ncbi:hypothetical protein DSECCO2_531400 [anaerobic digester metagenome]